MPDYPARRMVGRVEFQGPMPPPELVRQYEEILPGAAKFFFSSLDRQSNHRQDLERQVVGANIVNEKTGMWLAFFLAALMVLCGTFLIYSDKDPQGLAMIGGTIATFAGIFVYGRQKAGKELRAKDPAEPEGS
ncbi:MAG: DUF2335 domain-containing protein [Gemmatimonadota bacterium]